MSTPSECKVAEARSNDVVVEVWQKDGADGRTFFDVICKSEAGSDIGQRYLSTLLKFNDIPSLVIATMRAMEFISLAHRTIRNHEGERPLAATPDVVVDWKKPLKEFDEDTISGEHIRMMREVKCGAVVTELYDRGGDEGVGLRCRREYPAGGQWKRSLFIQQRDLRDLVISVAQVWQQLQGPVDGNTSGARGGYYQE